MKKRIALCLALLSVLTACASEPAPDKASKASEASAVTQTQAEENAYDVDIDLTTLSSTVIFSQLYNMLVDPTPYLGNVVRMSGTYIVYSDGSRACLISDEDGCCQEGVHFALREGIPYPEENTPVTLVGTFGTYYINDVLYCRIYDAILE